jgi:subtilase family serine protease
MGSKLCPKTFSVVLLVVFATILSGFAQNSRLVVNNTPPFVRTAQNVGPEDSSKQIEIAVYLRPHNESALHELVRQIYQKGSPNYHQWLRPQDLKTYFAPSAADAGVVQKFLTAHNLNVLSVEENNFTVKAQGTVADVGKAFRVQINKFQMNGKIHRANTADPAVDEPAGSLVAAVGGLDDLSFQPHSVRPVNPETGAAFPAVPVAPTPNGVFFEAQCFRGPQSLTFTTGGGLPTATYAGNRFGADISNTATGHLPPCGYSPAEIQTAYNLPALYAAGLNGAGQTVVIVDAFGSTTIQQDAELFSQIYGLPDLTSSNFTIIGTPTGANAGWASETTLDVEWAHAVAPNANIVLIVAPTNSFVDLNNAVLRAVTHNSGSVISNSYGAPEGLLPAALINAVNLPVELGAASGISVNFSSGDDGDFVNAVGFPTVNFPASSPFATSIGGTSLALNRDHSIAFQTGWGNNLTRIVDTVALGSPPIVPPLSLGFDFGAGGGASGFFAKPAFQSGLPGSTRLQPDISYLADPFTGVEIIETISGQATVSVIGGTSLACPMFSGLWAIAAQKAGGPVGQAAQLVYGLGGGAVIDVVPVGSANDVKGTNTTSTGKTLLSPSQLAAPLGNTKTFYSALYNSPFSTRWFVLTFGTDSSLTTAVGWDNVTGVGTPNGLRFVNAVVP